MGPKLVQEIPTSEFVEFWIGVVVSETSSYYTHVILPPHITKNFLHWNFGCITITKLDRSTFVKCCSTQQPCVIVWQCHNSKCDLWPSHWISLGRSNCPYTVCGHIFVFSLSVLILSCEFQSGVVQFAVYLFQNKLFYHMCIQSCHIVCKFRCQNICVPWICIVRKWPFLCTKQ